MELEGDELMININEFEVTLNTMIVDAFWYENVQKIVEKIKFCSEPEKRMCIYWLYMAKKCWLIDTLL